MTRSEVYVRCKVYDAAKAISCAFRGVCVELQNLRRPIASDVGRSELVKALASYFFGLEGPWLDSICLFMERQLIGSPPSYVGCSA